MHNFSLHKVCTALSRCPGVLLKLPLPLSGAEGKYRNQSEKNSFQGWFRLEVPADTVYQIYYGKTEENPLYLRVMANSGDDREPQIFTYTYEALLQTL